MRAFYFLIFYFFIYFSSVAQIKTDSNSAIIVMKDARLDELIQKQKEINIQKQSIPGYRVQIYFGGDRQKATDLKQEFIQKHPDMSAYLTYQQPNFKVRVGDFRTRLEATKFLRQLGDEYTFSFIVPDEISIKQLK
jgi:hypothetical protein